MTTDDAINEARRALDSALTCAVGAPQRAAHLRSAYEWAEIASGMAQLERPVRHANVHPVFRPALDAICPGGHDDAAR